MASLRLDNGRVLTRQAVDRPDVEAATARRRTTWSARSTASSCARRSARTTRKREKRLAKVAIHFEEDTRRRRSEALRRLRGRLARRASPASDDARQLRDHARLCQAVRSASQVREQARRGRRAEDTRARRTRVPRSAEAQEGRRAARGVADDLAKHLRRLATCLESAVAEGLLKENPVKRMPKSSKPKARKKLRAYFTDAELARLLVGLTVRPVYLTACKLATTTGLRIGEIPPGSPWRTSASPRASSTSVRQFSAGALVDRTKDNEPRVVDLVPAAKELLEDWYRETGNDGLVLENETGGYLDASNTRKVLYRAMEKAGIPRIGERGGPRLPLVPAHVRAGRVEHGTPLEWVQAQLGHSSITLTRDLYGHWSRKAEKVAARDGSRERSQSEDDYDGPRAARLLRASNLAGRRAALPRSSHEIPAKWAMRRARRCTERVLQ